MFNQSVMFLAKINLGLNTACTLPDYLLNTTLMCTVQILTQMVVLEPVDFAVS